MLIGCDFKKIKQKRFSNTWEKLSFLYMKILMKQYTEDMDQKLSGNKGPLVYAGIKSIVKSSLGKNVPTLILYVWRMMHSWICL